MPCRTLFAIDSTCKALGSKPASKKQLNEKAGITGSPANSLGSLVSNQKSHLEPPTRPQLQSQSQTEMPCYAPPLLASDGTFSIGKASKQREEFVKQYSLAPQPCADDVNWPDSSHAKVTPSQQEEEISLKPEPWLEKAVNDLLREQAGLLKTYPELDEEFDEESGEVSGDESDEDEYGMTAKGEAELLDIAVKTEESL